MNLKTASIIMATIALTWCLTSLSYRDSYKSILREACPLAVANVQEAKEISSRAIVATTGRNLAILEALNCPPQYLEQLKAR